MNDDNVEPIVAVLANGLGNQMSCIAGAIEYAKTLCSGRRVIVDAKGICMGINKHEENAEEFAAVKFWTGMAHVHTKPQNAASEYMHEKFLPHFQLINDAWALQRRNKNITILYKGYSYHHFATERILQETVERNVSIPPLSSSVPELTGLPSLDHCFYLHIRRGDFITLVNRIVFGINLTAYYHAAFKRFSSKLKLGARVLVFSDDIRWCQKNLPRVYKEVPPSAWCYATAIRADDTLILMASCKLGGITANSSLSWWGMILGNYKLKEGDKIYVTPENFIRALWPFQSIEASKVTLPRGVMSEKTGDVYIVNPIFIFSAVLLIILSALTYRTLKAGNIHQSQYLIQAERL